MTFTEQQIAEALNTLRRFKDEYEYGVSEDRHGALVYLDDVAEALNCRMSRFADEAEYDTVIPKEQE